jgi:hypothetical protein
MRLAAGLALLLAACSPNASGAPLADDAPIDCAIGGAAAFAPDCTVERSEEGGVRELIVRHPDGGFRRFELIDGDPGLATADGAEAGTIARTADGVEASIGGDRYRFPARLLADGRAD